MRKNLAVSYTALALAIILASLILYSGIRDTRLFPIISGSIALLAAVILATQIKQKRT